MSHVRKDVAFPPGMTVLERGWLSSNNILLEGHHNAALVDSGYATHAGQTVALVRQVLGSRPLDLLLNTHLHSDHCGGNASLQSAYPEVCTLVPPGQVESVRDWDPERLTYLPTGQQCERFLAQGVLAPGSVIPLGSNAWEVHAAPGHDPHSVILFEPQARVLISADALWQHGFGVVFPELEGESAFAEVAATLDLIEALRPKLVVPGHGSVFTDAAAALTIARARLDGFVNQPEKHARYAAKVLLKFKLLELKAVPVSALSEWARNTRYFQVLAHRWADQQDIGLWIEALVSELVRTGSARREEETLVDV